MPLFSTQWTHCTSGHSYLDLIPNSPDPLPASHCSQKEVKLPASTLSLRVPVCVRPTLLLTPLPTLGAQASLWALELDPCPGSVLGILLCARQPGWSLSTPHTADESPWRITYSVCPTPTAWGYFKGTSQGPGLAGSNVSQCACHTMDP